MNRKKREEKKKKGEIVYNKDRTNKRILCKIKMTEVKGRNLDLLKDKMHYGGV